MNVRETLETYSAQRREESRKVRRRLLIFTVINIAVYALAAVLTAYEYSMLREMCRYANNLYNKALYEIRQYFFLTGKYLRYEACYHVCKSNDNYRMLQAQTSQQVLKQADYAFKSFFAYLAQAKKGKYPKSRVRLPRYREKGQLSTLIIPAGHGGCYITDGLLNIPQSRNFFAAHNKHKIKLPLPERLRDKLIKEIHIIPVSNGRAFRIQYVYLAEAENLRLNPDNALAIDFGVDNLASCITSNGTSFIMDGRRIKSINHYWLKHMGRLQGIYAAQKIHQGKALHIITDKRNRRIEDIIHKTARYIINYCIAHDIGTVIAGVNPEMKQGLRIGHVNNQNLSYIPFNTLRTLIKTHCERYCMTYIEQEESYTSKASAYDGDILPVYGHDKPCEFSGRRIKRGLYRTASGCLVNADINGAANILRKCKQKGDFPRLCKGLLGSPARIRLS